MLHSIPVDIVTPEGLKYSKEVTMTVVPGVDGDMGILSGHAPTISQLRPGVVRMYDGGLVCAKILVTGGFVEVTGARCTVLADDAFDFADNSRTALQERLVAVQKVHAAAQDEEEKQKTAAEVSVAQAIVDAFIAEQDAR